MIDHDRRIEVRLFGALLALTLASNMVIDGLWILSHETLISKVARLSSYSEALSVWWFVAAILIVPYFLLQSFGIFGNHHRAIVRLACRAIMASGVLYAYLGFLSRELDYQYVTLSFVVMSLINMAMAAALAYGLNAAQIRKEEALKQTQNMTPEAVAAKEQADIEVCTEAVEQQRKEDAAS